MALAPHRTDASTADTAVVVVMEAGMGMVWRSSSKKRAWKMAVSASKLIYTYVITETVKANFTMKMAY